jgi:nifR3 family TIM-barrel protein
MKIGNIEIKNNLILAPMAGVTDLAFRSLAISYGADYAVGEMVSAKALKYKSKKTYDLLFTAPNEAIKVAQIFGSDAKIMAKAVKSIELQPFDIIDINMGCPAPKIVKNGEGSALMGNVELAKSIIEACVNATEKPITVKFRLGINGVNNAVEFAKMCEQAGAKAITVHGRTREQFYSGKCDIEAIKQVKQAVSIPVIANGDVFNRESYLNMLSTTGCDAVMVGRASLGNPEVFAEILGNNANINKLDQIKTHINLLLQYYPEIFVVKHMRKHILWYLKGERNSNMVKNEVVKKTKIADVIQVLEEFYANK